MHGYRSGHAAVLCILVLLALVASACPPPLQKPSQQAVPFTLSKPTLVSSGPVSLEVGTNRWPTPGTSLEEAFLPVAVTIRNTGDQPLCGGVSTAVLSDTAGASVSALFPAGVVTRLFGSFAALGPLSHPTLRTAMVRDQEAALLFVQWRGGGLSPGRSGFHGSTPGLPHTPRLPHLGPPARSFVPPPRSPRFSSPPSPFFPGHPGGYRGGMNQRGKGFHGGIPRPPHLGRSPWGMVPPPFAFPYSRPYAPLPPTPLVPWYSPFPPLSPYSPFPYAYPYDPTPPYAYPPVLPPELPPREEKPPQLDQALVKEILTVAFATRPLAAQEERKGFLFFPFPVPDTGSTTLTWDWYDCSTHALVAHLAVPIVVEKTV